MKKIILIFISTMSLFMSSCSKMEIDKTAIISSIYISNAEDDTQYQFNTVKNENETILKEYKTYWLIEKKNHGNLWAKTNRLFVQNGGNDMSNMTISSWLKEFQIKNNLKRVTSHGLRHTNITMLISNNVDIKTVSARAGHSDIQTTLNIYTHYFKQADKEASNKIDELFKRKSAS